MPCRHYRQPVLLAAYFCLFPLQFNREKEKEKNDDFTVGKPQWQKWQQHHLANDATQPPSLTAAAAEMKSFQAYPL